MVKAYSEDLRIRIVGRVKQGKESHQSIADNFRIGVATVRRWVKLYKDTGSVARIVPITTRPRKVDYNEVQKFIEKNPDQTLKEIGDIFNTISNL
jgi:transposase